MQGQADTSTAPAARGELPPFVYSRAFFGYKDLKRFAADPAAFLLEWSERSGSRGVSLMQLGPKPAALVKDPLLVREALVKNHAKLRKFPPIMRVLEQLDGKGIVTAAPKDWEGQRRVLQHAFRKEFLEIYAGTFHEILEDWRRTAGARAAPDGAVELDPRADMTSLTIRVIGRMLFGVDLRERERELAEAAKVVAKVFTHEFSQLVLPPRWWPTARNRAKWSAIRVLQAMAQDAIDRGRAPFLEMFDQAATEGKVSKEVMRDEVITLFMAGHDTTAAALNWVWYRLGTEPGWRERLRAECADPSDGAKVLDAFPQLTAFLYEAMRLQPPAITMFNREAAADLTLGAYFIPRGTMLYFSPLVCGRLPAYFAQPEVFRPERFLKDGAITRPSEAWFPFGTGPHVCVGMQLAMLEMKMLVAYFLRHSEMEPAEPFDGTHRIEFSLWPRGSNRWRQRWR